MLKFIELSNNIVINVTNITYIEVIGSHYMPTQYKIYFGHEEHYIIVNNSSDISNIRGAMTAL